MSEKIIEINSVGKAFKTDFWKKPIVALKDVSFSIERGSLFGLIGPNGAGKTTLIKILLDLVRPSLGDVKVFGQDWRKSEIKSRIGYLPEQTYYYDYLKPEEVLQFYGKLFGLSTSTIKQKSVELLKMVNLYTRRDRKLSHFSKGMLQRIGIAQALINDPELVIMDEPMSGLDPVGRKEVRDIILNLRDKGKTVLIASHILSDVEALCDKVAIVINGQLRACGPISDMVNANVKRIDITLQGDHKNLFSDKEKYSVRKVGKDTIVSLSKEDYLNIALSITQDNNINVLGVHRHKETLEDIFVDQVKDDRG
ncbi:MAG TPA: ABC transporter ATP-binding protein [Oligoflexia bacterium]|nr:ABC transporter ATP-binding protein [Oligoflexia bacterium]HMR24148.1 ABC transporter ATP-binding protein [Oligoflexia bacterium]